MELIYLAVEMIERGYSMPDIDPFAVSAEPLSDGTWVNSRIARIAEIIREYDSELEIRWLPRNERFKDDDVFQIVDKRINKVVFSVSDEASFNENVLERIFQADMEKNKGRPLDVLELLELKNNTAKLLRLKARIEEDEMKEEEVASILKSPLNAYNHRGIRFDRHPTDQPKKTIFVPSKRV